jgi:hypothetical protein
MMMYSLGHAGSAMESNAFIDLCEQSREMGLQALLKDCSFSVNHNFNLLSMSRLLHNQGWEIVSGNEALICIENGKGDVIEFDMIVPTEVGAIYACKLVCAMEIAKASTKNVVKLNINMAHWLLGHQNENSMWKTARELGCVLTRGT